MSVARIAKLEREIKGKMLGITNKSTTPKDSGIGKLLNSMKTLDEPTYDVLLAKYKEVLTLIKD